MKEYIYSRNAVYETLQAQRRHFFQLMIAEGIKEKGRINEIIKLARKRKENTAFNLFPLPKDHEADQNHYYPKRIDHDWNCIKTHCR